jgi:hypothetical protein
LPFNNSYLPEVKPNLNAQISHSFAYDICSWLNPDKGYLSRQTMRGLPHFANVACCYPYKQVAEIVHDRHAGGSRLSFD